MKKMQIGMKFWIKRAASCCAVMLVFAQTLCAGRCFIVKNGNQVIQRSGDCTTRYAPCSTFKIPLALMGYDLGILKNQKQPQYSFQPESDVFPEISKDGQTPQNWS